MLEFNPISREKENKPRQTFDQFVKKMDNLYKKANDADSQSEVLNKACKELSEFNDPSKTEIFLDHFKEEHGIKKTLMNQILERYYKERKSEDTTKVIPQVTQLEQFISRHFDIHFNEVSNRYLYKRKKEKKYKEFNEFNVIRFMRKNFMSCSRGQLIELIKSDFVPTTNPIKQYFENLPDWDGTDYIKKLCSYIKLEDEKGDRERFDRHMKKMFIRSIAAGLTIDFNKRTLVFVGGQDAGKTTFQRWLCPPALQDYATENIDFTNKDGLRSLSDNFWVILDELASIPKGDLNTVKSIMSRDKIKTRLPYDRDDTVLHRRCNFIANTNDDEFLSDPTGSVRWIAFRISDINWNYMKDIDINKVWGQAYYLLNKGDFEYDLTRDELRENEFANASFKRQTEEMQYIIKFFSPDIPFKYREDEEYLNQNPRLLTSTQVAEELGKRAEVYKRFSPVAVGRGLSELGFSKKSARNGQIVPVKYWRIFENEFNPKHEK
ncbi:MAG: VapE domain-containing protein [Bacteroidota bacterium]